MKHHVKKIKKENPIFLHFVILEGWQIIKQIFGYFELFCLLVHDKQTNKQMQSDFSSGLAGFQFSTFITSDQILL